MSTVLFYLILLVVVLAILSKIPGLDGLMRPIISMFFTLIQFIIANSWSWMIWVIKSILNAHIDLGRHLLHSAAKLDPTAEFRKK